jgi:hypothetical protein
MALSSAELLADSTAVLSDDFVAVLMVVMTAAMTGDNLDVCLVAQMADPTAA